MTNKSKERQDVPNSMPATDCYAYPHYLSGTQRRTFIEDGPPPLSPISVDAITQLEVLKDLMYAHYPVSPRTARIFDSVNSLRRNIVTPHPQVEHIRHYQAELDMVAAAWRESAPALYDAYQAARRPVLTLICTTQAQESKRHRNEFP